MMCTGRFSSYMLLLVSSAMIAFFVPTGTGKADFVPGRDAYLRGDFSEALALFLPSALQGNAKSQIGMGLLYARGHGTEVDILRSYSWFDMAAAHAENEHIVVRILARTNRDYLAKQMTSDQVAKAKLWSAMALAKSELLNTPNGAKSAQKRPERPRNRSAVSNVSLSQVAKTLAKLETKDRLQSSQVVETRYRIQLAALRQGQSAELRAIWQRLAKRYDFLGKLKPVLVRMDLGKNGVYEGLRAGLFDDSRRAYQMCHGLMEDKQDCIVVAR